MAPTPDPAPRPTPLPAGPYVLVHYVYVDDMATRRTPHRQAHLEAARRAQAEGLLVNAGAAGADVGEALLVFTDDGDPGHAAVRAFVAGDPYQRAGLIRSWRVLPLQVAV